MRVIDDWVTARPLGLVIEGKVGAGKIVVCGFDLAAGADDPVSRQMRASLIHYMNSDKFKPAVELTPGQILDLALTPAETATLRGVRSIKADSFEEDNEAANAIDGDPDTMWHTSWEGDMPGYPHFLEVEFDADRKLAGFTALPRQDGNQNGWIKDFAFYASADGKTWGEPVAKGAFAYNAKLKRVKFAKPVTAKFVKLVAESGYADGPWASLAEFNVIDAE